MSVQTLIKRPPEQRLGAWEFKNFPEIVGGDALSSAPSISVAPAGLTVGTPVIAGTQVQALVSGGTDGITYLLSATCTTASGKILNVPGFLMLVSS